MTEDTIKIGATIDYRNYCTFDFTVSTGWVRQSISFFGYTDTFNGFGRSLMKFPLSVTHEVLFQEGRDEDRGPGYLSIKAFCYDNQGHSALHIIMDNQECLPHKCRVEFSIIAEAASINSLGAKLSNWKIEQQDTIEWKAQIS